MPAPADKPKKKKVKLPAHLLKKVKTPGYDPETDTSLTDEEIALLALWKAAKEGHAPGKKRRKKTPPGVAEDLSDMVDPTKVKPTDGVEADSAAPIIEIDMKRLLMPRGKIPTGAPNFCTYYSPAVLDGWVKQHSPACAAASTAGAWNGCMAWHRLDKVALDQDKVVAAMKAVLEDKLDSRKAAMAAKLIMATEQAMQAVELWIKNFEQSMLDDKLKPWMWEKGEQKVDMVPRIRKVCDPSNYPADSAEQNCMKQILDWIDDEERRKKRKKKKAEKDAEDEPENEEVTEADADKSGGTPFSVLLSVVTHMTGYAKITDTRPSTSFFGNDGISQAVKRLTESSREIDISTDPFMGKAKGNDKSCAHVRLTDHDSPHQIAEQWNQLREEFISYKSTFIFHQINHYSMVYALREWMDYRGNKHRQLLTAKRGQRPTAWLDFHEVRRILLSWHGYKIIVIRRIAPNHFPGDWKVGGQMSVYKGPPRLPTPPEMEVTWDFDAFTGKKPRGGGGGNGAGGGAKKGGSKKPAGGKKKPGTTKKKPGTTKKKKAPAAAPPAEAAEAEARPPQVAPETELGPTRGASAASGSSGTTAASKTPASSARPKRKAKLPRIKAGGAH